MNNNLQETILEPVVADFLSPDEAREAVRFLKLFDTGHFKTEKEIKQIGMRPETARKLITLFELDMEIRKNAKEQTA